MSLSMFVSLFSFSLRYLRFGRISDSRASMRVISFRSSKSDFSCIILRYWKNSAVIIVDLASSGVILVNTIDCTLGELETPPRFRCVDETQVSVVAEVEDIELRKIVSTPIRFT